MLRSTDEQLVASSRLDINELSQFLCLTLVLVPTAVSSRLTWRPGPLRQSAGPVSKLVGSTAQHPESRLENPRIPLLSSEVQSGKRRL